MPYSSPKISCMRHFDNLDALTLFLYCSIVEVIVVEIVVIV